MLTRSLCLLACGLTASAASAAGTLTYTLDLSTPGSFSLFAQVSDGDNLGIASYQVNLVGDILTQDHLSPNGNVFDFPSFSPRGGVGFTLFRSADNVLGTYEASQDTVSPTDHIVIGFGQQAGTLESSVQSDGDAEVETIFGGEQAAYGDPLLIATGTYSGSLAFGSPLGGNLFNNGSTVNDASASPASQINTVVIPIPEPGSLALLGLGGLALMARRRRSA